MTWREALRARIQAFGHRNWIVIADSAYPDQVGPGIETVVADTDHLSVVREVLRSVGGTRHLRPVVHLDSELAAVPEEFAPGIEAYRQELSSALARTGPSIPHPHAELIATLGNVSQQFKVLLIKSNLALPYTSVFIELDCGYWSPESESALRKRMAG